VLLLFRKSFLLTAKKCSLLAVVFAQALHDSSDTPTFYIETTIRKTKT
jgi:hypothetical protein